MMIHVGSFIRRREILNWVITALIFLVSGMVAFWFASDLQPVAGLESLHQYLTAPGVALVLIGVALLVATAGMATSKAWAPALLRVMSYLLLALFFAGCLFMLVVWARKWMSEGASIGAQDIAAAGIIVLALVVGLRGLSTVRRLSSSNHQE